MKKLIGLLLVLTVCIVYASELGKKVAVVTMLRGNVQVTNEDGTSGKVKKGDWLLKGAMVKTADKSFLKVSFIDKSTMNIGPKSEVQIEKFSKDEAGVINVISGKIRSQVTKNYLDMDKDKSKLFIKSKSAVMGVRGTDFVFSTNKQTGATTAVLFEGKIVFNKFDSSKNLNNRNLENIVNKGRSILPGQFSVINHRVAKPTVPAKINSRQLRKLASNTNFERSNDAQANKPAKSVVPPGLSSSVVASSESGLKNGISNTSGVDVSSVKRSEITTDSKGFINGQDAKPADGAIVHLDSGTVVPLGSDSEFDSKKGEWTSDTAGSVNKNGEYVPPEGYKITETGDILKEVNGEIKKVETPVVALIDGAPPLNQLPVSEYKPFVGPSPASKPEPEPRPPQGEPPGNPERCRLNPSMCNAIPPNGPQVPKPLNSRPETQVNIKVD